MRSEILPTEDLVSQMFENLFPINRSLTGAGFRQTLEYLNRDFDAEYKSEKSGNQVFDWIVPPTWNIRDAYVKNVFGKKIIDFKLNNLSVVNYSIPVSLNLTEDELLKKLHSIPEEPDWIPYRTSYYKRDWGFCCAANLIKSADFVGPFEVYIDSDLDDSGSLIWSEALHIGKSSREILISTYACHPSMANDNLSGNILSRLLFSYIKSMKTKFTYRLVIIPETIGSLCFLKNHHDLEKILGGLVVTTVAGSDLIGLKNAFDKNHWINTMAQEVLRDSGISHKIYEFAPDGSDERQYSSPGFRIPTISITKSKYYEYSEYHTSADNLQFVSAKALLTTLELYKDLINKIENSKIPVRKENHGEYQLGKRGLFPNTSGFLKSSIMKTPNSEEYSESLIDAFGWIMNLADGTKTAETISRISGLPVEAIREGIDIFEKNDLVSFL